MAQDSAAPLRVLFLGASYGTVLGMRIAAAGHQVTFTCRGPEAALINDRKLVLRVPVKGRAAAVDIGAAHCRIAPDARVPDEVDPTGHDLVCLAMQEPQYGAPGVRGLIERIAAARIPCLSLMNMPLPPFVDRMFPLDPAAVRAIFTEPELWQDLDPALLTMASADPQAMRLPDEGLLITAVTLPTNFKVAPFTHARHQALLERLARDVDDCRVDIDGISYQPCVRLRPHASKWIPLAKWPMLITGNFRCLAPGAPVSIREAVGANEAESRQLYDWVVAVCRALGAEAETMVPFDAYRSAAEGLSLASSVARGLYAGARAVERVDMLIQAIAARLGMQHPVLDRIVAEVTARLKENRARG